MRCRGGRGVGGGGIDVFFLGEDMGWLIFDMGGERENWGWFLFWLVPLVFRDDV